MKIAKKISDALLTLNLADKDLAERIGKYSSEISKWLKGDHNFTIDTLSDIEEILGISLLDVEKDNSNKYIVQLYVLGGKEKAVEFNVDPTDFFNKALVTVSNHTSESSQTYIATEYCN